MAEKIIKFDYKWEPDTSDLTMHLWFIQQGDAFLKKRGRSLFYHFKEAEKLLWPDDDHHRWSDLILETYCEEEISVICGCGDSSKTWSMAKIVLVDYWAAPDETLWLVSTTEGRGSELRIWGVIKDLFNQARERFEYLQGNPIDYIKTITTDSIDDEKREARSLRRGIIVIPCKTGGVVSGLAPYIGIKAPRLRHAGDEVPAMSDSFLNAYSNWYGKEDFKGMMTGNFMETDDPLGIAAEPEGGWDLWEDSGKTQTWRSKFYHAKVVALDGRDSPNLDHPLSPSGRQKYPYLIGPKKLEGVAATKGKNSWEWYSQCVGKPAKGADIWRVLTRDYCLRNHASDDLVWQDDKILNLYALDPAYGGGDRCVGRQFQLGKRLDGVQTLLSFPPEIIPIRLGIEIDAEAQIAGYVFHRAKELSIAAKNIFYDSFGRGTLGFEFAKLFGMDCPVPVDSGAMPSDRPVRFDLFVEERDGQRRLKRCSEQYRKKITELYFSVYEAIGCDQIRGMDAETIREGCSRKFTKNQRGDNKIEIEKKEDYKERNRGQSPDLMDNFVVGVEGARQRGFQIIRIGKDVEAKKRNGQPDDLELYLLEKDEFEHSYELKVV